MQVENINKRYLLKNLKAIIDDAVPLIANLSNISRLLEESFENSLWCGFYLSDEEGKTLYLGPFQGPLACTKIPFGRGVCGTSALHKTTCLVPNVHDFSGHIACSSLSNSEIVVPIIKNDKVVGVIDLDSTLYNNYDLEDQELLEAAAKIISELF